MKKGTKVLLWCYVAFFAASLALGIFRFGQDRVLRATGKLTEQTYTVDDFALSGLVRLEDGRWVSTDADPRMLLVPSPAYVLRVDIEVETSLDPGEFNLFYMPAANMEEFSPAYRVWAEREGDTYTLTVPGKRLYGVRIDPGIFAGNVMTFHAIVFNRRVPVTAFFTLTRPWVFWLLILPPLAAAAVLWLQSALALGKESLAALKKR